MMYDLPKSVEICGQEFEINSDYRAILDICAALSDQGLSDEERGFVLLNIFYPGFSSIPPEYYGEAISRCFWFINCGKLEDAEKNSPKLMDWEQDFPYIVAPINRVFGQEIRALEYLHWWTFVSCYYEIGDCLFAQIVRIRELKRKGKKLDKQDREWYNRNRDLVDLKAAYTEAEERLLEKWGRGGGP